MPAVRCTMQGTFWIMTNSATSWHKFGWLMVVERLCCTVGTRLLHGSIVARSQLLHDTGSNHGPVRRPFYLVIY